MSGLQVRITRHARTRAHLRLGIDPASQDADAWWDTIAAAIYARAADGTRLSVTSKRTVLLEEHHLLTVSDEGDEVSIVVLVRRREQLLEVITLWVGSVNGEIEGPTWGRMWERACAFVDQVWSAAPANRIEERQVSP